MLSWFRSGSGGTGRRAGLRIQWGNPWGFESPLSHSSRGTIESPGFFTVGEDTESTEKRIAGSDNVATDAVDLYRCDRMSISQILEESALLAPHAPALMAPDRPSLDYFTLYDHIVRTTASLRRFGIERNDIVAVVLPNGPEMATAFLSVTAAAVC